MDGSGGRADEFAGRGASGSGGTHGGGFHDEGAYPGDVADGPSAAADGDPAAVDPQAAAGPGAVPLLLLGLLLAYLAYRWLSGRRRSRRGPAAVVGLRKKDDGEAHQNAAGA